MSRAPQGVYVNEAHHNELTRLVENALDGHGNLSGFIDYIEQALLHAAESASKQPEGTTTASPQPEEQDRTKTREPTPAEKAYARLRFRSWVAPNFRGEDNSPFDPPSKALVAYEQTWQEAAQFLPWDAEDARSHTFALLLHSRSPRLWTHDQPSNMFPSIKDALTTLRQAITGAPPREMVTELTDFATMLWRGNRLDLLLTEPKSRSTSFYVSRKAHEITLQLFGRDFFDRVERGLLNVLTHPDNLLPREPQLHFLEHGTALLDYQQPQWGHSDIEIFELFLNGLADTPRPDGLSPQEQVAWEDIDYDYIFGGFSWNHKHEADVILSGPEALGAYETSLALAHLLGLVNLHEHFDIDNTDIRSKLLPAFLERYELERIGPERQLAYQVLKIPAIPTRPSHVGNAVEYHLLKLFQQYALTVLPEDQQEEDRIHPAILATLAQPWVFPTRTTLELYGNATATKTATGDWQITKGRKTQLQMTDAEAYWTARTLNAVITTQPKRTTTRDFAAGEYFFLEEPEADGYDLETHALDPEAWLRALETTHPDTQTITYPLGPELLERAKKMISKAGPQPAPDAPVTAGVLLNAELTDEALNSNGKFYETFRQNTIHDFSNIILTHEQTEVLRAIANIVHGHNPASFYRTRNPNNLYTYAWAYASDGEEYALGDTFRLSIMSSIWSYQFSLKEDSLRTIYDWLTTTKQDLTDEETLREKIKTLGHENGIGHETYDPVDPEIDPTPAIEAVRKIRAIHEIASDLF